MTPEAKIRHDLENIRAARAPLASRIAELDIQVATLEAALLHFPRVTTGNGADSAKVRQPRKPRLATAPTRTTDNAEQVA